MSRSCVNRVGLIVLALALARPSLAGQPATALTTSFFKVDTGMTLQYVVQGDPKGPVVVLLHGAGDSWHSWELVLPHLPKAYRVYAVTLRFRAPG